MSRAIQINQQTLLNKEKHQAGRQIHTVKSPSNSEVLDVISDAQNLALDALRHNRKTIQPDDDDDSSDDDDDSSDDDDDDSSDGDDSSDDDDSSNDHDGSLEDIVKMSSKVDAVKQILTSAFEKPQMRNISIDTISSQSPPLSPKVSTRQPSFLPVVTPEFTALGAGIPRSLEEQKKRQQQIMQSSLSPTRQLQLSPRSAQIQEPENQKHKLENPTSSLLETQRQPAALSPRSAQIKIDKGQEHLNIDALVMSLMKNAEQLPETPMSTQLQQVPSSSLSHNQQKSYERMSPSQVYSPVISGHNDSRALGSPMSPTLVESLQNQSPLMPASPGGLILPKFTQHTPHHPNLQTRPHAPLPHPISQESQEQRTNIVPVQFAVAVAKPGAFQPPRGVLTNNDDDLLPTIALPASTSGEVANSSAEITDTLKQASLLTETVAAGVVAGALLVTDAVGTTTTHAMAEGYKTTSLAMTEVSKTTSLAMSEVSKTTSLAMTEVGKTTSQVMGTTTLAYNIIASKASAALADAVDQYGSVMADVKADDKDDVTDVVEAVENHEAYATVTKNNNDEVRDVTASPLNIALDVLGKGKAAIDKFRTASPKKQQPIEAPSTPTPIPTATVLARVTLSSGLTARNASQALSARYSPASAASFDGADIVGNGTPVAIKRRIYTSGDVSPSASNLSFSNLSPMCSYDATDMDFILTPNGYNRKFLAGEDVGLGEKLSMFFPNEDSFNHMAGNVDISRRPTFAEGQENIPTVVVSPAAVKAAITASSDFETMGDNIETELPDRFKNIDAPGSVVEENDDDSQRGEDFYGAAPGSPNSHASQRSDMSEEFYAPNPTNAIVNNTVDQIIKSVNQEFGSKINFDDGAVNQEFGSKINFDDGDADSLCPMREVSVHSPIKKIDDSNTIVSTLSNSTGVTGTGRAANLAKATMATAMPVARATENSGELARKVSEVLSPHNSSSSAVSGGQPRFSGGINTVNRPRDVSRASARTDFSDDETGRFSTGLDTAYTSRGASDSDSSGSEWVLTSDEESTIHDDASIEQRALTKIVEDTIEGESDLGTLSRVFCGYNDHDRLSQLVHARAKVQAGEEKRARQEKLERKKKKEQKRKKRELRRQKLRDEHVTDEEMQKLRKDRKFKKEEERSKKEEQERKVNKMREEIKAEQLIAAARF